MISRTTWLTNNHNTLIANISRSKSYQKMEFGQLMEYKERNIFLQKSRKNEAGKLVSRLLFVL